MRIAYLTRCNPFDDMPWNASLKGLQSAILHFGRALQRQGHEVFYLWPSFECSEYHWKYRYYADRGEVFSPHTEHAYQKLCAKDLDTQLCTRQYDCLLSLDDALFYAYLQNSLPRYLFRDVCVSEVFAYYKQFATICQETKDNLLALERMVTQSCDHVYYTSTWGVETACKRLHLDPSKVSELPYGANIDAVPSQQEVEQWIASRSYDKCHLVWIGRDWQRKGAAKAIEITTLLNENGVSTQLTLIGAVPPHDTTVPSCVRILPEVSADQRNVFLQKAHFLLLPAEAECFGHVLCEAGAFGVPCFATRTGGIPSIICDGVNGFLFSNDADASLYSQKINTVLQSPIEYQKLAQTAYDVFRARFDWNVIAASIVLDQQYPVLQEDHFCQVQGS